PQRDRGEGSPDGLLDPAVQLFEPHARRPELERAQGLGERVAGGGSGLLLDAPADEPALDVRQLGVEVNAAEELPVAHAAESLAARRDRVHVSPAGDDHRTADVVRAHHRVHLRVARKDPQGRAAYAGRVVDALEGGRDESVEPALTQLRLQALAHDDTAWVLRAERTAGRTSVASLSASPSGVSPSTGRATMAISFTPWRAISTSLRVHSC